MHGFVTIQKKEDLWLEDKKTKHAEGLAVEVEGPTLLKKILEVHRLVGPTNPTHSFLVDHANFSVLIQMDGKYQINGGW